MASDVMEMSIDGPRREVTSRLGAAGRMLLSRADVEALGADNSAARRAAVAAKLGHDVAGLVPGAERDVARAVPELLVVDVAREVRTSLAEAVADLAVLPPTIALRCATDEIEVAAPVLSRSPVLGDEALAEIVRTHALQYALPVAGRQPISEAPSEALLATGDEAVTLRLLGNHGARIAAGTLVALFDAHRDQPSIEDRLLRRPELPFPRSSGCWTRSASVSPGALSRRVELRRIRPGRWRPPCTIG